MFKIRELDCELTVARTGRHTAATQTNLGTKTMANIRTKSVKDMGNGHNMGLSTPSLLTFLLSFVIMLSVFFAKFFDASIPGLNGETTQFAGLLFAYIILTMGCLLRSF